MTHPHRGDEAPVALPPSLAARPRDPRRRLPVPPVNLHLDPATGVSAVDFTNLNTTISTDLAASRRCSLCGVEMGYWVAFLGGPRAAELMRYTDPPGCPDYLDSFNSKVADVGRVCGLSDDRRVHSIDKTAFRSRVDTPTLGGSAVFHRCWSWVAATGSSGSVESSERNQNSDRCAPQRKGLARPPTRRRSR